MIRYDPLFATPHHLRKSDERSLPYNRFLRVQPRNLMVADLDDAVRLPAGKAAARYLYAEYPGPDGMTTIDFNKTYNPPCAYTNFATCPLPPASNRLDLAIRAGEKKQLSSPGGH